MFFSKNVLTIEKNQRILPKLLVFPLKKYQERGDSQGKIQLLGVICMTKVALKIEVSIMVEILGVIS